MRAKSPAQAALRPAGAKNGFGFAENCFLHYIDTQKRNLYITLTLRAQEAK